MARQSLAPRGTSLTEMSNTMFSFHLQMPIASPEIGREGGSEGGREREGVRE